MHGQAIPPELDDNHLLTLEELAALIDAPDATIQTWRHQSIGPRRWRFDRTGRLYATAGEMRRFLRGGQ